MLAGFRGFGFAAWGFRVAWGLKYLRGFLEVSFQGSARVIWFWALRIGLGSWGF